MTENKPVLPPEWDDSDLPEWTDEMFEVAALGVGGKVVRPATGYLARTASFAAARRYAGAQSSR